MILSPSLQSPAPVVWKDEKRYRGSPPISRGGDVSISGWDTWNCLLGVRQQFFAGGICNQRLIKLHRKFQEDGEQ